MITKFDEFDINSPKVGDYVICTVNDYFSNYIGRIKAGNIGYKNELIIINYPKYIIKNYFKIDRFDKDNISYGKDAIAVRYDEIKYFSDNKKELQLILNANKYNL